MINLESMFVVLKKEREELQKKERGTFDKYVCRSNQLNEENNAIIYQLDDTDNNLNRENNSTENELKPESNNIDKDIIFNHNKNTFEVSINNTHIDSEFKEKLNSKNDNSIFDFNDPASWPEYINNDLIADIVMELLK